MTKTVIPLLQGFDYQARWFWCEALRLLRSEPVLDRVAIEADGPRGFDDIVSHPIAARDRDVYGQLVDVDGFQAKFHVDHSRVIRARDLADPEFIFAKTSLLQRLQAAVVAAQRAGLHGRFTVITPWRVDREDLLAKLCGSDGELRLTVLMDGSGDRSETGRVRKAWRDHLQLADDEALGQLVRHLRILERDLVSTDRELERELETAGLALVQAGSVTHPYVDLIQGHLKRAETEFNAPTLRRSLTAASMWRTSPSSPFSGRTIAIRSRRKGVAHLEDEASELLDLIPLFHDRALANGVDWDGDVAPQIARFVTEKIEGGVAYRLYLDAHSAIAFAAGWLMHRADVTPMQTVDGRLVAWPALGSSGPDTQLWEVRTAAVGMGGPDVAVALSVTHPVLNDVLDYVTRRLPEVGLILGLTVPSVGRTSVRDGTHARALAEKAVALARTHRPRAGLPSCVHLFAAAPNGLMFQLGRVGHALGRTVVYEFDFENPHLGYGPAITCPPEDAP